MDRTEQLVLAAIAAAALLAVVVFLVLRGRRASRDRAAHQRAIESQLHLPPSLHPVIDADVCIGSLACIQACPEGDILGIVDGAAKLIVGSNCIGHGRCAAECPVGAIKLVFGSAERGVDLPEIDAHFESSRAGVHVVGELGGMGLIKNAITQGLQVAEHLASSMTGVRAGAAAVDVAIVGAGPAGLATALGCRAAGLSYRLLEQDLLGGTIAHYPRHKVVMTERVKLPLYGSFGKPEISKEQLLFTWQKIVEKAGLRVEEGVRVTGVDGGDGAFTVSTSRGEVAARKVVLATGRRGTPRKLEVAGEELPKVCYALDDAAQYAGARVVVVGGGDSALEAAASLSEQPDTDVTIVHRGNAFTRCRDANRRKVQALVEAGRVRARFESQVSSIGDDSIELRTPAGLERLGNDWVIVLIGGELPTSFLASIGVALKRHRGETHAHVEPPLKLRTPSRKAGAATARPRASSRLGWVLFFIGAAIVAGLAIHGGRYYLLPRAARRLSPLHASLKPSGLWGHGVGIAATAVMLSNFLYAARKRWQLLKGAGSIRAWLTWHMFVGFMSPIVIGFHAAFQSNNLIATSTYYSLLVVVGTGIIGRYIYGLVPGGGAEKTPEVSLLRAEIERLRGAIEPELDGMKRLHRLARAAEPPSDGGSLLLHLLSLPLRRFGERISLRLARRHFDDAGAYASFRYAIERLGQLRTQVTFARSLKRLLSAWRIFHVVLAVALVVIMTSHIGISLYLGYRWIFR